MAYSEIGKAATNKYRAKFDLIQIRVQQGDRKLVADHADAHGESVNAFINRAIRETMERDKENPK